MTPDATPCTVCGVTHDPRNCNGHRRPVRRGERPTQCGRLRPGGVGSSSEDLCFGHSQTTRLVPHPSPDVDRIEAVIQKAERVAPATAVDIPRPPPELGRIHNPGAVSIDNPVLTLAKVAGVLYEAFAAAGERVNELTSVSVETRAGGEQLRGEIVLWEKLLGHLRGILVDMAKLNLDERLVRLEERRADLVAESLFWFTATLVKSLDLDLAGRTVVEELMKRTVLRIVSMQEPPSTATSMDPLILQGVVIENGRVPQAR